VRQAFMGRQRPRQKHDYLRARDNRSHPLTNCAFSFTATVHALTEPLSISFPRLLIPVISHRVPVAFINKQLLVYPHSFEPPSLVQHLIITVAYR